ncbi:MAG: hypothetical protein ISQ08_12110 [Planctomycetes bacterium]|nr:hypothetical protein [Planctomycetota bacterium]
MGSRLGGVLMLAWAGCGGEAGSAPGAPADAPSVSAAPLETWEGLLDGLELRELARVQGAVALACTLEGLPLVATERGTLECSGREPLTVPGAGPILQVLDRGTRLAVRRAERLHEWDPSAGRWTRGAHTVGPLTLLPDGRLADHAQQQLRVHEGGQPRALFTCGDAAAVVVEVSGRVHGVRITQDGALTIRTGVWGLPLPAEPGAIAAQGARAVLYRSAALDDPLHALDGSLLVVAPGQRGLAAWLSVPLGASRAWSATPLWSGGPPLLDLAEGPDGEVLVLAADGRVLRLAAAGLEPLPPLTPEAAGPDGDPLGPALEALASPSAPARGRALAHLLDSGPAGLAALREATAHARPAAAARPLWTLASQGPERASFVEQLLYRSEPTLRGAATAALVAAGAASPAALLTACSDEQAWIRALSAPAVPSLGWPGGAAALEALLERWDPEDPLESEAVVRAAAAAEALDPEGWSDQTQADDQREARLLRVLRGG